MTAITGTTVITAPISPSDTDDTYATHMAEYGQGGFVSAGSQSAREAIPDARREEGMWVQQTDDSSVWRLIGGITNSDWEQVTFSGGGGSGLETWTPTVSDAASLIDNDTINATVTPTANGVQVDSIATSQPTAAMGDYDKHVFDSTLRGFYASITGAADLDNTTIYLGFADGNPLTGDPQTTYTVGIALYKDGTDSTWYVEDMGFGGNRTAITFADVDSTNLCVAVSIASDDQSGVVSLYKDGAAGDSPFWTYTITAANISDVGGLNGRESTPFIFSQNGDGSLTQFLSFETGTPEYTAVTKYTNGLQIDTSSYPSSRASAGYVIEGMASEPVKSEIGEVYNGTVFVFDDSSNAKTKTDVVQNYVLADQSNSWDAEQVFNGGVVIDGLYTDMIPLKQKNDDLITLESWRKYQWIKTNSGSTTATVNLPDGQTSGNDESLFQYLDFEVTGVTTKDVNIISSNGTFYLDGADTGSATYNIKQGSYRFVYGNIASSNRHWQVLDMTASGGDNLKIGDDTTFVEVDTNSNQIEINPNNTHGGLEFINQGSFNEARFTDGMMAVFYDGDDNYLGQVGSGSTDTLNFYSEKTISIGSINTSSEVNLQLQTSEMNDGIPNDLAIASAKYVKDNVNASTGDFYVASGGEGDTVTSFTNMAILNDGLIAVCGVGTNISVFEEIDGVYTNIYTTSSFEGNVLIELAEDKIAVLDQFGNLQAYAWNGTILQAEGSQSALGVTSRAFGTKIADNSIAMATSSGFAQCEYSGSSWTVTYSNIIGTLSDNSSLATLSSTFIIFANTTTDKLEVYVKSGSNWISNSEEDLKFNSGRLASTPNGVDYSYTLLDIGADTLQNFTWDSSTQVSTAENEYITVNLATGGYIASYDNVNLYHLTTTGTTLQKYQLTGYASEKYVDEKFNSDGDIALTSTEGDVTIEASGDNVTGVVNINGAYGVNITNQFGGDIIMPNLPTTDPSIAGALWVDAANSFVLKVSQG